METKAIVSIRLIRENPQKDSGIVRIESIELEDEYGNIESDYSTGFEFQCHEESNESCLAMINEIAKRYGVAPEIIDFGE